MPSNNGSSGGVAKSAWRLAAAMTVIGLMTACGDGERKAVLPTTSAPTAPSAASPSTDEGAIRETYTQYWVALPKAEQASDASERTKILKPYLEDKALDKALRNIDKLHKRHQTSWGSVAVRIEKVQLTGDSATVWDCQSSENAGLKDSRTGKKISRGVPNDRWKAVLARGADGQWRISTFSSVGRC